MENTTFRFPLLPYRARIIGLVLIVAGFIFGWLYFYGGRPSFFETKVFAIVSSYLKNRFFVVAKTNLLDELFAILCVSGIALMVFSREKVEKEGYDLIRAHALIRAVYFTLLFCIVSFLLVFGWAIFVVTSLLFIIFLFAYYIIFRILIRCAAKREQKDISLPPVQK